MRRKKNKKSCEEEKRGTVRVTAVAFFLVCLVCVFARNGVNFFLFRIIYRSVWRNMRKKG